MERYLKGHGTVRQTRRDGDDILVKVGQPGAYTWQRLKFEDYKRRLVTRRRTADGTSAELTPDEGSFDVSDKTGPVP